MDAIRNMLLAGLGAVSYSQDKLKEAISTLIERGQLTREQGEKVIAEWKDRGQQEQENLSERLSEEFQKVLGKLPVVSREEFNTLATRVEELEKKLTDT